MTNPRLEHAAPGGAWKLWARMIAAPLVYLFLAQLPLYYLATDGCRTKAYPLLHLVSAVSLLLLVLGTVRATPATGDDQSDGLVRYVSRLLHGFFALVTLVSWCYVVLRACIAP